MIAFDTDILSVLGKAVPAVLARVSAIPFDQRFVPIVAAEEAIRGQLATVRQAQSGRGAVSLEEAYEFLTETIDCLRPMKLLPYTTTADALFRSWKAAKLRVGSQDLRIAAICFAHGATLVTRNARDYAQVPGLALDVWN